MRFGSFASAAVLLVSAVNAAPAAQKADSLIGMGVGDIINALKIGLVSHINTYITLDSLVTNLVSVDFDAKNPLPFEIAIERVVSKAGVNGTEYARFDQKFSPAIIVSPFGSQNSGKFDNVLLTQGALSSLDIIPLGYLDLQSTDVYLRAGTIKGKLGIPIPIEGVHQANVPTAYTLDLGA